MNAAKVGLIFFLSPLGAATVRRLCSGEKDHANIDVCGRFRGDVGRCDECVGAELSVTADHDGGGVRGRRTDGHDCAHRG